MSEFSGKVAVVTGAASGIGRALARELARRGARLALSDVNAPGLAETALLITGEVPSAQVQSSRLDVSDRAAVAAYADTVAARYGVVHQLYNNAGIAGFGKIGETPWEVFDRVIAVDLWGVIHGTRAFLPHLLASGDGHVVNVSSVYGIMGAPDNGPYCAAKFGVRGFTEVLRAELERERAPVKVTVVHPGGVRTNVATATLELGRELGHEPTEEDLRLLRIYNERFLRMPPERAAQIILAGVQAGKPRVLVGNDAKLIDLLVRAFPGSHARVQLAIERLVARITQLSAAR